MARFPITFEVQFISDKVLLAILAIRLVDPWGLEGEMDARDSLSPSTVASSAASVTATAAAAARNVQMSASNLVSAGGIFDFTRSGIKRDNFLSNH